MSAPVSRRHCAVCGWVSRDGVDLPGWCPKCRGRCVADVADLPEFYRTLAVVMQPGASGEDVKVGGSRTPPLPLRLDAANLRGPATAGEVPGPDQHGALSIATVLGCTRQLVRDACRLPSELAVDTAAMGTQAQVERDADFLITWLDRYAERVGRPGNDGVPAEEFAAVVEGIAAVRNRAYSACGYRAHKVRLGPCPADLGQGQTCGEELWIDPVLADSVTCRACGSRWDKRYFLWLRRMAGEDGVPA